MGSETTQQTVEESIDTKLRALLATSRTNGGYVGKWELREAIDDFNESPANVLRYIERDEERVDTLYLLAKKMERRYLDPNHPLDAYYAPCFKSLDAAYSRRDLRAFSEGIDFLGVSIHWE